MSKKQHDMSEFDEYTRKNACANCGALQNTKEYLEPCKGLDYLSRMGQ